MDRRKRSYRRRCTDRLSNLPCSVIGHILTFLPLKEAARTSVLSTKWKDKWLTIPRLVFDSGITESVIYQVLLLHKEPIVKFAIKGTFIESPTALNHWLNFLSKHRIEDLIIMRDCHDCDWPVMPSHLFCFHYLKHLSLRYVNVRVPSMYNGFSNLLSIDLDGVSIEPEDLQRFILKCPMLESVRIVNYDMEYETLDISAPTNLKSFKFRGEVDFIYIDSNARLEDVTIVYDAFPEAETGTETPTALNYAVQFFSQLSPIKKLKVNCCFLQVLARSVPSMFTKSLDGLKHIHFKSIALRRGDNLIPAVCLIRSSPNLQTLVLALKYDTFDTIHYERDDAIQYQEAIQYLKLLEMSSIPLCSSLKEVKFVNFGGSEPQMEFVKILLFWANELRKVEIELIKSKQESCVLKKLAGFPRASSQAVILFN